MKRINCEDLFNAIDRDAKLVDVRNPSELMSGKIGESINVPLSLLREEVYKMFKPDDEIMIYCRSGARADAAVEILEDMGFENVTNIGGVVHYRNCLELNTK